MNHDASIGERLALARRTRPKQKSAHTCIKNELKFGSLDHSWFAGAANKTLQRHTSGHSETNCLHIARNEFHSIKDGKARRDRSTGAVDILHHLSSKVKGE
jgi:hypothetical protein